MKIVNHAWRCCYAQSRLTWLIGPKHASSSSDNWGPRPSRVKKIDSLFIFTGIPSGSLCGGESRKAPNSLQASSPNESRENALSLAKIGELARRLSPEERKLLIKKQAPKLKFGSLNSPQPFLLAPRRRIRGLRREWNSNLFSHKRVSVALQATVEIISEKWNTEVCESFTTLSSFTFLYKINKRDLPVIYFCVFWCEFIDSVDSLALLWEFHLHQAISCMRYRVEEYRFL